MAGFGILRATFLGLCIAVSVPAQRAGTGSGHGANNAAQAQGAPAAMHHPGAVGPVARHMDGQVVSQGAAPAAQNSPAVTYTAPPTVSRAPGPNLGGQPYPIRNDIAPPTGLIPPAAAYTGISPNGLRTVGGHSRRSFFPAFGGVYPYYGGYLSGSDLPPVESAADQAYAADPGTSQLAAAQDAMAEQIRQLSADLQNLKSSPNPAPASPATSAVSAAPAPEQAPIQIILRSGERLTVKSYAVMSGVLWDFSGQRVRKVPVSNIDISASSKATEAAGGDFPQLSGH